MDIFTGAKEFLDRYFIEPMYTGEGYNLPNTIVYGIALGLGIIASYKIIKKLNIDIDRRFLYSLLPFLVFGSTVRALADAEIIPKIFPFLTPGIFFTTFLLYVPLLVISVRLGYYPKLNIIFGTILCIYPTLLLIKNISYISPLYYTILYLVLFSLLLYPLKFKIERFFLLVFLAHFFDLSATITGVNHFNYFEEHYFENILIEYSGTSFILLPMKIGVLLIAYKILSFLEPLERRFWYVALFILGFSPGLRDLYKMMLIG